MDEEFLLQAMRSSGEDNILSIKVCRGICSNFFGREPGGSFLNIKK